MTCRASGSFTDVYESSIEYREMTAIAKHADWMKRTERERYACLRVRPCSCDLCHHNSQLTLTAFTNLPLEIVQIILWFVAFTYPRKAAMVIPHDRDGSAVYQWFAQDLAMALSLKKMRHKKHLIRYDTLGPISKHWNSSVSLMTIEDLPWLKRYVDPLWVPWFTGEMVLPPTWYSLSLEDCFEIRAARISDIPMEILEPHLDKRIRIVSFPMDTRATNTAYEYEQMPGGYECLVSGDILCRVDYPFPESLELTNDTNCETLRELYADIQDAYFN